MPNLYNENDLDTKEDYYAELAKKIAEQNVGAAEYPADNSPVHANNRPASKPNKKPAADIEEPEIPNIKHKPDKVEEYRIRSEPVENEPEPILSSNEAIFPGGPLLSDIEEWKMEFPAAEQYKVCCTQIDDIYFVFRTLNRYEYKQIINLNISATGREEAICNTCTLWPFNYTHKAMANGRAGIPATYANIIMQESGFVKEFSITEL